MTAGGYKESYCEAYVDQQSGNSSVISAGNALAITAGSLTNIGSLISAGTSATINVAGPVVNEAQTLNAYWHSHWVQETGMFSSDKRHDTWACGSLAECQALYGSAYTGGTIDPPQPVGNIAATIQAPSLSISSGGQIENVGNVIGTSVSLTGQKLINGITTANTYTPRVNGASQVISLSPVSLASLNLSIPRTLGSGTIPVAVAGTASYVDSSLGSSASYTPQYLISNLPASLQPSSTLFYYSPQEEDLLLQQAALQQTGKASLVDGLSYDSKTGLSVTEQEKAYLYQNALSYAQSSNLQLGVALTQTQISTLDKPMLWYVEQTVPDPSCTASGTASCPTITALMPQIYLPQNTATMTAGGNITGTDVTLNFGQSVVNTGSVTASNTLSVTTGSLVNQANQVNVGQVWSSVAGGYVNTTGTTVQPGGFMSAANMDLNVQTLTQVGGALQALNADGTVNAANSAALAAQIQSQLAGSFTQTAVGDDLNTSFVKAGGSFSLTDLAAMAVAVAASIATYGAASGAIGMLATSAGSTLSAATAGAAATSAGLGNIVLSAAAAGMVSSAASQIVSTGGLDLKQIGSAGLIAGLTAGLLNGITYSSADGLGFNTGVTGVNAPTLANLAGIQNLANSGVSQAGTSVASTAAGTAGAIAATSAISAAVQTAVGGGSWLDNFEHAAVSGAAAAGAFEIGGLHSATSDSVLSGTSVSGQLAYLAAHAALGCASSAALGTGCGSGALGGAASAAFSADVIQSIDASGVALDAGQRAALAGFATLLGSGVGALAGANVQGAATAAQNEALNNAGEHATEAAKNGGLLSAVGSWVQTTYSHPLDDISRWAGQVVSQIQARSGQASPMDWNDQIPGGGNPPATGGAVVTLPAAVCLPRSGCVIAPLVAGIGTPSNASFASRNGSDGADNAVSDSVTKSPAGDVDPSTPTGGKGSPMDVRRGTNSPTTVDGVNYSGHALDEMQEDGIVPSVVKNAIETTSPILGKKTGTAAYYDSANNITVVTNLSSGKVVTVSLGKIKQ